MAPLARAEALQFWAHGQRCVLHSTAGGQLETLWLSLESSSLFSPLISQMQQAHPPSCMSSAVSKGLSLAEAPERRPWLLCRDQGNMFDEVLLLGDAGPVACSRAPLHSLASSTAALISFDNQSGRAVR